MKNISISTLVDFSIKNPKNKLSHSLEEYKKITKAHMLKYLSNQILAKNSIPISHVQFLISNEDIFSNLVTAIMMADWSFDAEKSSRNYWRTKCILFTLSRMYRENENIIQEVESTEYFLYNTKPDADIIRYEAEDITSKAIKKLKSKKRHIIKLYYYKNKSEAEIGEQFKVSQQRIHQILDDCKYELAPKLTCIL